jgi:hypothetical protein
MAVPGYPKQEVQMRTVVGSFRSKEDADKALDALGDEIDRNAVDIATSDNGITTVTARVDDGAADAVHAVFEQAGSAVDEFGSDTNDPEAEALDNFRDPSSIVAPIPR